MKNDIQKVDKQRRELSFIGELEYGDGGGGVCCWGGGGCG